VLRQVVAEELGRRSATDDRLTLLTVTAVEVEPDLRRAKVLFADLEEEAARAVGDHRAQLQEAISRQVRMKRTPQLSFEVDPAVVQGRRVDDILRHLALPSIEGPSIEGPPGEGPPRAEPPPAGDDE
jgi:ribosome-binding factor A